GENLYVGIFLEGSSIGGGSNTNTSNFPIAQVAGVDCQAANCLLPVSSGTYGYLLAHVPGNDAKTPFQIGFYPVDLCGYSNGGSSVPAGCTSGVFNRAKPAVSGDATTGLIKYEVKISVGQLSSNTSTMPAVNASPFVVDAAKTETSEQINLNIHADKP